MDGGVDGASELFTSPVVLLQQVYQSVHDGVCRDKQASTNIGRHRDGTTAARDAGCQVLELRPCRPGSISNSYIYMELYNSI